MSTAPTANRSLSLALHNLSSIAEQVHDLQALLLPMDELPATVAADALGTLSRIDLELGELVQQIGEAGPA